VTRAFHHLAEFTLHGIKDENGTHRELSLSKGCHLDVVRGSSTPHDPESDAGGSLSSWQGHPSRQGQGGGKKLRITLGEGNSDNISPDAGSSDISSDMKHRTVDG
jgi:hypothetical protein